MLGHRLLTRPAAGCSSLLSHWLQIQLLEFRNLFAKCDRSSAASEESNEEQRPGLKRNSSVSWGRFVDMINETVGLMYCKANLNNDIEIVFIFM